MSDLAMEAWKARGRTLNELYDVLSPAVGKRTGDPVADLESLVAERDRYRSALLSIRHYVDMERLPLVDRIIVRVDNALNESADSASDETQQPTEEDRT